MSKIAIIGAGKTGRGFIARLLTAESRDFIFIDKNEKLVHDLNATKSFKISFFGNEASPITVNNYAAYTYENADLNDCELIFVSVCGQNLKDVGAPLKNLLDKNKKYYIITCENATNPSKTLKEAIGMDNVSVSESTVFCTTIEDKNLDISSENYPYLQFDADLLNGFDPNIKGFVPVKNFGNFLTRKLFTYNAASCIIAYLGYLKGYTDYSKAANDPEILKQLDYNYEITNKVLCIEFGYDKKEQEEFALLSRAKFCNKTIIDTIARNAREPQRKLGRAERIIGPMKLIYKYGEDYSVLSKTAAAMLLYDNEKEDEWRKIKDTMTFGEILTNICGLPKGGDLYNSILSYVDKLK
ncbi:MAG: 2-dehydropantoate 2-reductase N-terminal domain-containing protein [Bacillota bacterium]|nr:2-dehydropantoate 2-reductase N-terminal domain-containing protein [Bacillota bacterium]